jgi:hypothetical protein
MSQRAVIATAAPTVDSEVPRAAYQKRSMSESRTVGGPLATSSPSAHKQAVAAPPFVHTLLESTVYASNNNPLRVEALCSAKIASGLAAPPVSSGWNGVAR